MRVATVESIHGVRLSVEDSKDGSVTLTVDTGDSLARRTYQFSPKVAGILAESIKAAAKGW